MQAIRKQIKNYTHFNYSDLSKRVSFFYSKYDICSYKGHVNQDIELIQMHKKDSLSRNSSDQLTIHKLGLYLFISGGILNFFEHIKDKTIDVSSIDLSLLLMSTGYLISQCTNVVDVITNNQNKSDLTWCFKDFCPIKLNKVADEVRLGLSAAIACILLQYLICLTRVNFRFEKFLQNFSYPQQQISHPLKIILHPLLEEVIFRKSILSLYKKEFEKYGSSKINTQIWSIILNSLTFMTMHKPYYINHFFMRLIFGALMNVTDSRLLAPYVAHTLNNAIVELIDYCEDYQRIVMIGVLFLLFVALYDRELYQRYFSINRITPDQVEEISSASINESEDIGELLEMSPIKVNLTSK